MNNINYPALITDMVFTPVILNEMAVKFNGKSEHPCEDELREWFYDVAIDGYIIQPARRYDSYFTQYWNFAMSELLKHVDWDVVRERFFDACVKVAVKERQLKAITG